MNYKLVCIDIDGTLLNSKHQVTETTKKILRKVQEMGINIAISTGRIYADAEYYSNLIGVKAPVISANGAFIKEKDRDEVIYKCVLDDSLSLKILEIVKQYNVTPNFYTPYKLYVGNIYLKFFYQFFIIRGLFSKKVKVQTVFSREQWKKILQKEKDNIVKCEIIHKDKALLQKIRKELERIEDLEIVSSVGFNIEIMHKGVSKGRAVEILAGYYNLTDKEVIAIGDSENDLSMIEYAGLGIAMGNALAAVKEKADFVTDYNDNEGVAKAINKFVLRDPESI